MKHRFSNSWKTRQGILATAGRPMFPTWEAIPYHFRMLILEHILLTAQEVLSEV